MNNMILTHILAQIR